MPQFKYLDQNNSEIETSKTSFKILPEMFK